MNTKQQPAWMHRRVLAPCPPSKKCKICLSRLSERFGSADHSAQYAHCAEMNGREAIRLMESSGSLEAIEKAVRRAYEWANELLEAKRGLNGTEHAEDCVTRIEVKS